MQSELCESGVLSVGQCAAFGYLSIRGRVGTFQISEEPCKNDNGCYGENDFRSQLSVGQSIKREEPIENAQRRDFQYDFTQNGECKSCFSHPDSLEHGDCEKIHAQKRKTQTEATQKLGPVRDDLFILHE